MRIGPPLACCLLLALAATARAQDGAETPRAPTATELVARLAAEEVGERQKAAYALYQLGAGASPAALSLARALADEDAYVRDVAARTLAKLGSAAEAAVPAVAGWLGSPRQEVRREAATLLFRLGATSAGAVKQLTAALDSEDHVVRANCAATLGNCGEGALTAREQLDSLLADDQESVRKQAAGALATLDPLGAFAHEDAGVREAAVRGQLLFGKKSDAVLDALLAALDDDVVAVRMWAGNALATAFILADDERRAASLPRLKTALAEDVAPAVRVAVAHTLGRYAKTPEAVVPALVAQAKADETPSVHRACIQPSAWMQALGWIGAASHDDVFPLLLNGLADPDPTMRQLAATSFLWGKGCSERVLRALRGALSDPDRSVRSSAAGAIGARKEGAGALVPALITCYRRYADLRTRAAVVNALAVMGKPARAAVPLLEEALAADESNLTVAYALCMLHTPDEHAALDLLLAAARTDAKRFLALQYFVRIGEGAKRAVPLLVEFLEGDRPRLRLEAAGYLGQMGALAAAAIPALVSAAAGQDAELAKMASDALLSIRPAKGAEDAR